MCPEYGATVAIFPIDEMTLDYLRLTGRDDAQVALVEAYAKAQGLFRTDGHAGRGVQRDARARSRHGRAEPRRARAGRRIACRWRRRRPRSRRRCRELQKGVKKRAGRSAGRRGGRRGRLGSTLEHGRVVIAAITSCTNTSNPSVMIGAGLLAKKAVRARAHAEAVGEDEPGARLEGRHRVPAQGRASTAVPRPARVQPRRLRLHDVHRQQRSAARRRGGRDPRARTWSSPRC